MFYDHYQKEVVKGFEEHDMDTLEEIALVIFIVWIIVNLIEKNPDDPHKKLRVQDEDPNAARQHWATLKESLDILYETTDPETFFSRVGILSFAGPRSEIQKIFITRLFACAQEDRLTFALDKVGGYLTKEAERYFLERLAGKQYHFCKVSFKNQKLYTYISRDRSIRKGDFVLIPVVSGSKRSVMVKQVAETFDASLDELEFPLERLRCIEEKIMPASVEHIGLTNRGS